MNNDLLKFFKNFNLYNYIKKGGKNLYVYRIDDEITKQAGEIIKTKESSKSEEEKLKEKLEEINNKFNIDNSKVDDLTSELELKKLDEITLDQDKIKQTAEDELYEYKQSNLESINNEKIEKEKELNNNKEALKESVEKSKTELDSYYDNARENASNDALKRGLQRSSIIINVLDAFNKDEIETYKKLDSELNDNINAINFELNALTSKQQQALDEFDITYAAKLNSKINELTNQLKEKQEEIIKYNNEIAKTEEDYNIKYENLKNELNDSNFDKEIDLIELSAKYGINTVNKYKESLVYDAVKEYLSTLDKSTALNYLRTNELIKDQLGSYYDLLLSEYKN